MFCALHCQVKLLNFHSKIKTYIQTFIKKFSSEVHNMTVGLTTANLAT